MPLTLLMCGHVEKHHSLNKCQSCYNKDYRRRNLEKLRKRNREWGKRQPVSYAWAKNLLRMYGLSSVEYDRMFLEQHGQCAICGSTETKNARTSRLCVDHKDDKIRALLCSNCNRTLGMFCDNPEFLRKAADYIEKYL